MEVIITDLPSQSRFSLKYLSVLICEVQAVFVERLVELYLVMSVPSLLQRQRRSRSHSHGVFSGASATLASVARGHVLLGVSAHACTRLVVRTLDLRFSMSL